MKSESEIRYTNIVTAFVEKNKTKLKLEDARIAMEECPMNQDQFSAWAWDLFRVKRDAAREIYRQVKGGYQNE